MKKTYKIKKTFSDLSEALNFYQIWMLLSYNDIRVRYIRSSLGPFWITLSTIIMILMMGPLYGTIFGVSASEYMLYLSVSLVIWTFISTTINEASLVFVSAEAFIKQIKLPYLFYVFRLISRNFIVFLHNSVILIVVYYLSSAHTIFALLYILLGFLLLLLNLIWISTIIAMLGARFRDINQIVVNLVQISFFMSPIMWKIEMLPSNRLFLATFNPFFHMIEMIRRPILNQEINIINYQIAFIMFLIGSMITIIIFNKYRSKIVYWI